MSPQNQIPAHTRVVDGKNIINGNATDAENRLADYANHKAQKNPHGAAATDVGAIAATARGTAGGVAPLDSAGLLPTIHLPPLAVNDTHAVASQAAMLGLTAQRGDIAVRTDLNRSFVLAADDSTVLGNWMELATPTDAVQSVDGRSGVVDLSNKYGLISKYVEVTRGVNLPVPHATWTIVPHDTTNQNLDNMWLDSSTLITRGAGVYLIVFSGRWQSNNTGERIAEITVSSLAINDQDRRQASGTAGFHCTVLGWIGDGVTIQSRVFQSSTVELQLQASNLLFSMTKLR